MSSQYALRPSAPGICWAGNERSENRLSVQKNRGTHLACLDHAKAKGSLRDPPSSTGRMGYTPPATDRVPGLLHREVFSAAVISSTRYKTASGAGPAVPVHLHRSVAGHI